jgi:LPXTG-site transpeptidase (sortase) family protein
VIDGQWDISELGTAVGLLQTTGSRPGDNWGMAFIGHVTVPWPDTGPFADLILLEHGEEVIYRWNGTDYVYEVERVFLVSPQSVETLYQPHGDTIVLATCSSWDYLKRDYVQRLVTRARLVRQEKTATVSLAR